MRKRGFSLVELVLVIALLGVVTMSLGSWMITTMQGFDLVTTRREMLGQVRAGFERMMLEIILIPSQAQITTTNASSMTFQYPVGTNITYSLSGTNLMRNSDILVQNVTALAFTYYDEAGNTTSTASNVRSVQATVTAKTNTSTQPFKVRSRVFIRNTGNNYGTFTSP